LVDLHIHLLPGIDDGCPDLQATVELARVAVADGVTSLAVTPHVNNRYATTPQSMNAALEVTRGALAIADIPLDISGGAEIALDRVGSLSDHDLRALCLGGTGRYALLECPFAVEPIGIESHSARLSKLGVKTILAHPERSAGVQSAAGFETLRKAVGRGLLVQINAGSLTGHLGESSRATAHKLLAEGLVHFISSDAHHATDRPTRMSEAAAAVGDRELALWLTDSAPAAVLAGEALPPRPELRRRKRSRLGLGKRAV
jgi:protein-tyrosine phosphatase